NEPIHSPSSPNRDHLSRHPDRRAFPSKLSRHRRPGEFPAWPSFSLHQSGDLRPNTIARRYHIHRLDVTLLSLARPSDQALFRRGLAAAPRNP
ncbi:hypothetical protein CN150_35670, partial [Sinorhizobium meliloti]